MRVLVAGVGYHNLRDLSVGPELVQELKQRRWPQWVEVDDLSFGPIAVVQRFQALEEPYGRVVLVSAVERGRRPGQITTYRWQGILPDAEEIQTRVGESIMGVISLDNLLVVGEHFGIFPRDVIVVEIEPADTGWGPGFTPVVAKALGDIIETVRRAAMDGYDG